MTDTKLHLVKGISLRLAEQFLRAGFGFDAHREDNDVVGSLLTPGGREATAEAIADFAEKLCLAADRHRVVLTKIGGQTMHLPEEDPFEAEVVRERQSG